MGTFPVNLERVLENYMISFMSDVFTAIPAVVVSVQNIDENRISVLPCTTLKYKDGTELTLPEIINIPICFPVSRNAGMTFEISQGDTVYIVFSMRSIDKFKEGITTPASDISERYMDYNDAVALVGLNTFKESVLDKNKHKFEFDVTDTAIFANLGKSNESKILLRKDGSIKIFSSSTVEHICKTVSIGNDLDVKGKAIIGDVVVKSGATGQFVSLDGKTVFVENGIIKLVV